MAAKNSEVLRGKVAIVGGGVIGFAVAEKFSRVIQPKDEIGVVVINASKRPGQDGSEHNSQVVHSGIYYEPTTLKALLCVPGNHLITQYAGYKEVGYSPTGKLVVATTKTEKTKLDAIHERAKANGVQGIRELDTAKIRDLEPKVKAHKGLLVPSTGTIDAAGLVRRLAHDFERNGGDIMNSTAVLKGEIRNDGVLLEFGNVEKTAEGSVITGEVQQAIFEQVIICAGINSQAVARSIEGIPDGSIPATEYAKGYYYRYQPHPDEAPPFARHVYPIPVPGGLGIHATKGRDKSVQFGPNIERLPTPEHPSPLDVPDYTFYDRPGRKGEFVKAIRSYYPTLNPDQLKEGETGIRPKISRSGDEDFTLLSQPELGTPRVVIVVAESPGLTSSLAFGETIWEMTKHGTSAKEAALNLFWEQRDPGILNTYSLDQMVTVYKGYQ